MNFLSIDIGGSKSNYVVFDENNNVLESFVTRGFGNSYESDEALPEFTDALSRIADGYNICSVAVNLGGKNKNQVAQAIRNVMPDIPMSVHRESEATAAIAFGKIHGADVVLLAGTGTIVVGSGSDGRYAVCGGWGMNVGDGGSGYDIGLEAIKQSLAALDLCVPLTMLQQEITGLEAPISVHSETPTICSIRDGVRNRLYPLERRHIASYCKTVVAHCENDEEDALAIMKDAGRKMAYLVVSCINKLGGGKDKVAVSGGLVNCKKFWQEEFESIIRKECNVQYFVYETDGVSHGTRMIALEQYIKDKRR